MTLWPAALVASFFVILRHLPAFCLQHDAALSVLRVEWVAGGNMQDFRNGAEQVLTLVQDQAVRHLLIDMNTLPDLPVAEQLWLGEHWMPGLVASGLERLVLVIASHQVHNQLAIDFLHDLVQPAIRFDSQYFSDSAMAFGWITDDSARVPALEAEWQARY